HSQALAEFVPNREILQAGEIVGVADDAFLHLNESRDANTDPRQVLCSASIAQRLDRHGHVVEYGLASCGVFRFSRDLVEHDASLANRGCTQVGPAQIKTDTEISHTECSDNGRLFPVLQV